MIHPNSVHRLPKFRRKIKRLLSCIWPSHVDKHESAYPFMRVKYTVGTHTIRKGSVVTRTHAGPGVTFSLSPASDSKATRKRGVRYRQRLESLEDDSYVVEFKTVTILSSEDCKATKEVMVVCLGDKTFNLIHHSGKGRRLSL